jgi:hypothetical protein
MLIDSRYGIYAAVFLYKAGVAFLERIFIANADL